MGKNIDSPKIQTIDPVCGMTVDPASARGSVEFGGKTYHFCSAQCVRKFEQDPAKYQNARPALPGLVTLGAPAPAAPTSIAKEIDPVCGMLVDPAAAKHRFEHKGKNYFFCCGGCLEKFRSDPVRFLGPKPAATLVHLGAAPVASATHNATVTAAPVRASQSPGSLTAAPTFARCVPKYASPNPGPCPSCGMALEPESLLPFRRSNTPARCIPRSCAPSQAAVPSVEWLWNPAR